MGPLAVPPVDDLRAAATAWAERVPRARLRQDLDAPAGLWREHAASAEEAGHAAVVLREGPGPDGAGFGAFCRDVDALRAGSTPVRWVVSGRYLSLALDHAVGDAGLMMALLSGLVTTARTGELPTVLEQPDTGHPLARALAHHYRGRWDRVRAAAAAVQPGGPVQPGEPRQQDGDRRPAMTAVHAFASPETSTRLKAWRREHAPGRAVTAVHTSLVRAGLAAAGAPPRGRPIVLVDARRYLPAGSSVHGNFVAGLDLPVTDRWGIDEVDDALARALEAGRPLTAMSAGITRGAARALRARVGAALAPSGGGQPPPARSQRAPLDPRPVVAVTGMGGFASIERLPWVAPPGERLFSSMSTASPREGVTAAITEVGRALQVSLSFHGSVFDAAVMQDAVRRITQDPLALLVPERQPSGADGA